MVLYLIGLGLGNAKDITLRGLEAIRSSMYVYLESYTSHLIDSSHEELEELYGKKIILADRELVEKKADEILKKAKDSDVSFLVAGDPFSATTHIDLYLRAKEKGISLEIIHNASILTAVGIVGLELYKYGPVTSMPFFEKSFEPETPYNVIKKNRELGWHTLVLLDIKADQKRFMTVNQAIEQLFAIEKKREESVFTRDLMIVGCARLGSVTPFIKYGGASDLSTQDFGKPLHCLIVPGKLHFMEEEMLGKWIK